jgi:hypothetical protein
MVNKREIVDALTDIIGVLGLITSFSAIVLGYIPIQYATQAVAVFAGIAIAGSFLRKVIDIIQGLPVDEEPIEPVNPVQPVEPVNSPDFNKEPPVLEDQPLD